MPMEYPTGKHGRIARAVSLTKEAQEQIESYLRSRVMPSRPKALFRMILLAADGFTNKEISETGSLTRAVVGKCRKRYADKRLEVLHDELQPCRPRSVLDK